MKSKATVLIIDPDSRVCHLLKDVLEQAKMTVTIANDSQTGLLLFNKQPYDLVVCEAHFPHESDFALVRQIRTISNVPILVLSDLTHDAHRIQGFELGIADYVVKPFSPREVQLRIERLLVYFYEPSPFKKVGNHYVFADMTVDVAHQQVEVERKKVKLSPREFQLLCYFLEHPKQVISRRELLTEVWGYQYFGEERTVDVQVSSLRNKLKKYSTTAGQRIRTERQRGYYFEP